MPTKIPDELMHLYNESAKYDAPAKFVAAVRANKCLAIGQWVKTKDLAITGQIKSEGVVGRQRWPCWEIDTRGGTGRTEVVPKDDPGLIHVTGCRDDSLLVMLWHERHKHPIAKEVISNG